MKQEKFKALPNPFSYRQVNICASAVKNRNHSTTVSSLLSQGPLHIINIKHLSSAVTSCTLQMSCCLTGIWCLFSGHLGTERQEGITKAGKIRQNPYAMRPQTVSLSGAISESNHLFKIARLIAKGHFTIYSSDEYLSHSFEPCLN